MRDPFGTYPRKPDDVGVGHVALTPDDDNDLEVAVRAVYCQAEGTVVIRDEAGVELPYTMARGEILLIRPQRILATGTTGTYYGWI